MEESVTLSMNSAVMMAAALIVNLLLIPFPFLWPYRLAKARRRFPERVKFSLFAGLACYLLVAIAAAISLAVAVALSMAGLLGDMQMTPLGIYFSFGWIVTAVAIVVASVWISDYFADRWRDWVDRYLRR